jgi:hypothetical protein
MDDIRDVQIPRPSSMKLKNTKAVIMDDIRYVQILRPSSWMVSEMYRYQGSCRLES